MVGPLIGVRKLQKNKPHYVSVKHSHCCLSRVWDEGVQPSSDMRSATTQACGEKTSLSMCLITFSDELKVLKSSLAKPFLSTCLPPCALTSEELCIPSPFTMNKASEMNQNKVLQPCQTNKSTKKKCTCSEHNVTFVSITCVFYAFLIYCFAIVKGAVSRYSVIFCAFFARAKKMATACASVADIRP